MSCPIKGIGSTKNEESSSTHHPLCPVKKDSSSSSAGDSSEHQFHNNNKHHHPLHLKGKDKDKDIEESKGYKHSNVYNVYSQPIDPTNNMPQRAQQAPIIPQSGSLSTTRVNASIPKGGTADETWTYPSPQMFYNALVRKNKVEGATEEQMDTVVAIHNNMNESTWQQVMAWEKLQAPVSGKYEPGCEPKLLRFLGRPHDLSPLARIRSFFGQPEPFDRHDWVVDRGGTEVRYVIDYYHDESAVGKDKRPNNMLDAAAMKSIVLDVRPALDSFEAIYARMVKMPLKLMQRQTSYRPLPLMPSLQTVSAERKSVEELNEKWRRVQKNCSSSKLALEECGDDEVACSRAYIQLQTCIADVVCADVARTFRECIKNDGSEVDMANAFDNVTGCVHDFELDSRVKVTQRTLTR